MSADAVRELMTEATDNLARAIYTAVRLRKTIAGEELDQVTIEGALAEADSLAELLISLAADQAGGAPGPDWRAAGAQAMNRMAKDTQRASS